MALNLASIRARVKDTGLFRRVEDVLSLASARDNPGSMLPAAFVVLPRESAEPNRRDQGSHRQRIKARVSIAFVVPAQGNAVDGGDAVEAIRTALKGQMAGWTPAGAETVLQYVTSSILEIGRGLVWVEMLFEADYYLTVTA